MVFDLEDDIGKYALKYENISKAERMLISRVTSALQEMNKHYKLKRLNFDARDIGTTNRVAICGRTIKFRFHKDVRNNVGYWDWIFPDFNPDKGIEEEYLMFTCKYNSEYNLTKDDRTCNYERINLGNLQPFLTKCIYDFSLAVDDRISKKYGER